jgi:hypothetical protein
MNEISTALGVLFPYAAAGDIAYRDPAGAYLSALAKPSVNSFLRNKSSGVPDYLATDNIPGLLHKSSSADFAPGGQSFSGGWADISGATLNLTLAYTCTIFIFATITGYNATTGRIFYVRGNINGTADASPNNQKNGGGFRNEGLSYFYRLSGVAAGVRTIKLQCQADTDPNVVDSGRLLVMAYVE